MERQYNHKPQCRNQGPLTSCIVADSTHTPPMGQVLRDVMHVHGMHRLLGRQSVLQYLG